MTSNLEGHVKGVVVVRGTVVALVVAAPLLACGCGAKASGPSTWNYTVDFGSVASAVSVDTVEVSVFDAAVVGARCENLVAARRSKADLPKTVATFSSSTCDFARNKVPVTVGYATYSVMVVGRQKGRDWLIGCNTQYVTSNEDPGTLSISLTNFADDVIVPATSCQTLTDHCAGAC